MDKHTVEMFKMKNKTKRPHENKIKLEKLDAFSMQFKKT